MRSFDVLTPEALLERSGGKEQSEETTSAQVIEETLEVGKTKVSAGKRLTTEVSEREVQENVTLHEENVEVERTRADRTLKPEEADKAFKETTVEVTGLHRKAGGVQGSACGRGSLPEQELRRARSDGERDGPPPGCHGRRRRREGENLQEVLTTAHLTIAEEPPDGGSSTIPTFLNSIQNSQPFTCRMTSTAASARIRPIFWTLTILPAAPMLPLPAPFPTAPSEGLEPPSGRNCTRCCEIFA